ncbi:MAG: CBS domain-containing protein [Magnetococcales bacterium]|nr:CBS domain-containing protein [Magnetococcales bacterium]
MPINVVRDCMFQNILTLSPSHTVMEAMRQMVRQDPGFAVVLDNNMSLVGLITEFDLLRWMVNDYDLERFIIADASVSAPRTVNENTPCQEVFRIFNQNRFRRFPVVNEDGLLCGGIMEKQMLSALPRSNLLAHYRVSDLLGTADPPLVAPELSFQETARLLVKWHRGCVLVHRDKRLLGIVTERDLLVRRVAPDWDPHMPVECFMSTGPTTIEPQMNLLFALDLFQGAGHRRLPVVTREGELQGLLTQTDLLRQMSHAVRSHMAVLNPEDIAEPALWFEPAGEHRLMALNAKGAAMLGLDPKLSVGASVNDLVEDQTLWDAVTVLLRHCGGFGPVHLSLRTGQGGKLCVGSRFSLVDTPTGEKRIFWVLTEAESGRGGCRI